MFDSFTFLFIHNIFCSLFLVTNLAKDYAFSALDSTFVMQVAFNLFECKRQHVLLPRCFEFLQSQHFSCRDNVTRSFLCRFCGCGLGLNYGPIHPCSFILVSINCLFALIPCVAVDCFSLLFLASAIEFFLADAVTIPDAVAELLLAQLVYSLKSFCDGF